MALDEVERRWLEGQFKSLDDKFDAQDRTNGRFEGYFTEMRNETKTLAKDTAVLLGKFAVIMMLLTALIAGAISLYTKGKP